MFPKLCFLRRKLPWALPSWPASAEALVTSVVSDSLPPLWTVAPPDSSVCGSLQAGMLSGLPFPPPGELPDPGIEPGSPALAGRFLTSLLNSQNQYQVPDPSSVHSAFQGVLLRMGLALVGPTLTCKRAGHLGTVLGSSVSGKTTPVLILFSQSPSHQPELRRGCHLGVFNDNARLSQPGCLLLRPLGP